VSVVAAAAASEDEARNTRLVAAGLLAGAGGLAVTLTYAVTWNSTTLIEAHQTAFARALLVAAWIAVGSLMAWRRVDRSIAVLVASAGFLFSVQALTALGDARAYTIGRVVLSGVTVFIAYVALRVAHDLLGAPLRRRFIGALSGALVVLWALTLPVAEKLPASGQFSYCGDSCPPNGFNVVTWPRVGDALGSLIGLTTGAALAGVAVLLIAGARAAPPRRQYAYQPLIYALTLWAFSYVLFTATRSVSFESYDTFLRFIGTVGAVGTPLALYVAQGRGRAFAAGRVETLVTEGGDTSPERVLDLVRDGLGDPTATLAVFDDSSGGFVDIDANAVDVDLGTPVEGRVLVSRGGRVVAALHYDPRVTDHPAARALAGAALTLLENHRLVAELRSSQARNAATGEAERRRLERDLHDGAQQNLLSLRLQLGEIERGADPATATRLAALDADLAAALDDLRTIAHGIYPPVLQDRGVPDALRARALRTPLSIHVDADGVGRFDPSAELAVYFCALEAVQNATRHGGPAVAVEISFGREGDEVVFAVADDGPGFDVRAANGGFGLTTMRDRIGAVGGRLEIDSEAGRGTTVRGRVPA
jgi:signal transduction histidine kinase